MRISGVLSDIVLIFNFPSSSTEGFEAERAAAETNEAAIEVGSGDWGCCTFNLLPLSDVSNSSPELRALEITQKWIKKNLQF